MNELEIKKLIRQQRAFFYKGRTLPVKTRIHMLKRLRCCILKYQEEIRRLADCYLVDFVHTKDFWEFISG